MTPQFGNAPRCFFLNTYYQAFLETFYRLNSSLTTAPYEAQMLLLTKERFGDSDFYSAGLQASGWSTTDLITNCAPLQNRWAHENNFQGSLEDIVCEQIRRGQPDIVYCQDMHSISGLFLQKIRPYTKLIVGQIASPFNNLPLSAYDIVFSSFPHFVERFRKEGTATYYQPLAFEKRLSTEIPPLSYPERTVPLSFVGSLSRDHGKRFTFLESIAAEFPLLLWGLGAGEITPTSPLTGRHQGEAWGKGMFQVLSNSKITLNAHIDAASTFANNMRLFEATGCGTLLLTDYKDNLSDLFEIGKEVVAYRNTEECKELLRYYLLNPKEAEAIAQAGRERTLREHSYTLRMKNSAEILTRHLRYKKEKHSYVPPQQDKISYGHQAISSHTIDEKLTTAWKSREIPLRQRALVQQELMSMYRGEPPRVYQSLAEILKRITSTHSTLLEIGCSSGYYYEVLEYLLQHPISYTGVDYSEPMIELARNFYPQTSFHVADGAQMPFPDESFDIGISSCVIIHTPNYQDHIRETARVSKHYVVSHRTPVCKNRPTQYLKKYAYGVETVELLYHEQEILNEFRKNNLVLIDSLVVDSNPGEDTHSITYLFQKQR